MSLINKSDKIFLAGHKGMVGSAIYKCLEKNNYKNIITASRKTLDLRNQQLVTQWFEHHKPNVAILAAAKVGGINANNIYPFDFLLENLQIQTNFIQSAWENGVKRLLFLGSSCIYPKFAEQPIVEEELLQSGLEETNQWYAIAKISGIKLCDALSKQYGFDAISLMPTNLYGPGDNYHPHNSHVFPALIRKFNEALDNNISKVTCWGTGAPFREFLHVNDLADACIFSLENWDPEKSDSPKTQNGQVLTYLNVGTGKEISLKHLAQEIGSASQFSGEIYWDISKPDGTPRKLLNVDRLKNMGWKPKISLMQGIKETIQNYKIEKEKYKLRSK